MILSNILPFNSEQLKQSKLIDKIKNNIAFILILVPLVADILTGFIDVTVGINLPFGALVRFFILLWAINFVVTQNRFESQLIIIFAAFFLSLCAYWFFLQQGSYFSIDLKNFFVLLLPFCVYLLFINFKNIKAFENKLTLSLSLYGLIASSSIIVFYFLGIGYESYGDYTFGSKGVFISGNDIGINLVLCSAIAWYRICTRSLLIDFISAFSSYLGLIFIASRTGLIFGSLVLLLGVFCYLFFYKSKKISILFIKMFILFIVIIIGFAVTWFAMQFAEDITYHVVRLIELIDGVSPRANLEYAASQIYDSLTINNVLLGQGNVFFSAIGEEHYLRMTLHSDKPFNKMIEKDFHDLFGYAGLLFTCFYSSILVIILVALIKSFILHFNKIALVSLGLFMFLMIHAFFAGHIFFGSQVPIIAATIIFLGINVNKLGKNCV